MPRSTTVWAAALVLASFSGSGPLLTTAEAMPAPGPQETQHPRYYFPRHVKRQIVTNSTAPAAPTSQSSSSSEQLQSRQFGSPSFLAPFLNPRPDTSSSSIVSSSVDDAITSTVTSIQEIFVTPVPEGLPGTGNLRPSPAPASSSSVDEIEILPPRPAASSSPKPSPSPIREPETEPEETPSRPSSSGLPAVIIPASSSAPSPSSAPAGGLLSSLLGGVVGSTGVLPIVEPTPTPAPSPAAPVSSSQADQRVASSGLIPEIIIPASSTPAPVSSSQADPPVGSSGPIPEIIVPASSTPAPSASPEASPEPSAPAASSFLGPFIVPGSSGGIPSSEPTPTSEGLLGGLLSSILGPEATPTPDPQVGSTGVLPSSFALPTPSEAAPSSQQPLLVLPSSGGIVVGITTALGTAPVASASSPPLSSGPIPTSEAAPSSSDAPLDLPGLLSSAISEVPGVLPSGSAGPTAPITPSPTPTPIGILPPIVSSLASDLSSLLSSVPDLPASVVPSIVSSFASEIPVSATAPVPIPDASSLASSVLVSLSGSGVVPTPSEAPSVPIPSETPSITPSVALPSETLSLSVSPGITPPSPSEASSGILPSGSAGTGVSSLPIPTPSAAESSIPTSEAPLSTPSGSPSSIAPPSSGNATISEAPVVSTPAASSSVITESATIPIPSTPAFTPSRTPVQSQQATGTDSATSMVIGTSIIQETASNSAPTPTSSGIPSSLPQMIAPPGGVPAPGKDAFTGQVCFKWPLNYPFVSQNDAGPQIFHFLPKALADGLNISLSDVQNLGLKPLDTTAYQGFITTLALFTIPKDLQSKLAAQLRNPADPFWHNKDQTVNDLTSLINTACPLAYGNTPNGANPNQAANPAATNSGGSGDGGAIGGDMNASRPINGSAAGIATGAIVGAIAYGAAMFFVARRYRNKRLAHQRASSVPSTGSRMTYGSIPGGAAAWMHGARNGRITPASRGSRGSSSSQGRSVRTQQISAPVMAENSLGWN